MINIMSSYSWLYWPACNDNKRAGRYVASRLTFLFLFFSFLFVLNCVKESSPFQRLLDCLCTMCILFTVWSAASLAITAGVQCSGIEIEVQRIQKSLKEVIFWKSSTPSGDCQVAELNVPERPRQEVYHYDIKLLFFFFF